MSTATIAALLLLYGPDPAIAAGSLVVPAPVETPAVPPEVPAAAPQMPASEAQVATPAATTPAATTPAPTTPAEAPVQPAQGAPSQPPASPAAPGDDNAIVVTGRVKSPSDPAQAINLKSYEVVNAVDKAFVGPVAKGYEKGVPGPVRSGLHNFLSNLTEPVVFVNFLLQGKPGKAFETLGRFTVNTTVGVAGLVDVAKKKPFNLPHRNNGFADTLGFYGVGPGPYFFLPIIGPTTLRDLFGWGLDKAFLPTLAGAPFSSPAYAIGSGTVKSLDDRVEFDAKLREFRASDDPYVAERKYYLAQRKAEIEALHGRKAEAPAPVPAPAAAPVLESVPVTAAPSEPAPPAPPEAPSPPPPQT